MSSTLRQSASALRPAALRPSPIAHHINRLNKLCSCCREPYHTIKTCPDERIYELHRKCFEQAPLFISEQEFTNWLLSYVNIHVAKALCLQYEFATYSNLNTKTKIINILIIHYWRLPIIQHMFDELSESYANVLLNLSKQTNSIQIIEEEKKEEEKEKEKEKEENNSTPCSCPICYESESIHKYNCNHTICIDCLKKTIDTLSTTQLLTCSLCRTQITHITSKSKEDTVLLSILLSK